jgi:hypothetical protein
MKLVENLDWSLPKEIQQNAMDQLIKIDPNKCDLLMQEMMKPTWHNSTLVIKEIGYPLNKKAIPTLLFLLQDLNWPGVKTAFEILQAVDKSYLVPLLEQNIEEAFNEEDYMWLGGIKYFVISSKIMRNDFQNPGIYDLLRYSDY